MAYSVREERQSLATSMREDLAEAERLIIQLRRDNVESFLQLLDSIDARFTQLESSGMDLRPEQSRWGSLHSKLRREANRVMRLLNAAGGVEKLRQANPPAQGLWWRLDAVVAAARRHFIRQQVAYWWTLGMVRLAIGDLEEACTAGNEALALDPSDPQGYFLLGTVAEVRGDTGAAIDFFEKTFQLAADSNTQLAAVARIRMGTLLQRSASISLPGEDQPDAGESSGSGSCQ